MKKLLVTVLVGGLCTLGCGKTVTNPGIYKTPTMKHPMFGIPTGPAKGASITLTAPAPVTVKQGEKTTVPLTAKRTDYKGDVNLTFDAPPTSGLTIAPTNMAGATDQATITVDATKAKPGNYAVTATGKGKDLDKSATAQFKVTVTAAAPSKGPEKAPDKTPAKSPEK